MTIRDCLQGLSAEDKRAVREYYESIQPFHVPPSETKEYDAQFVDEAGEPIFTEITLCRDSDRIEDMYCTCGADGFCIHLAAMMWDMERPDDMLVQ